MNKLDGSEDYIESSVAKRTIKGPDYITMINKTTQKKVDFKIMAAILLGITYQDLYDGVEFM
eukprot:1187367-Ditylum_brightwellii.AAC.1